MFSPSRPTPTPKTLIYVAVMGRSHGEGKVYPLQYSGLENSMNSIVHGVAKSQARLSTFTFTSLSQVVLLS